MPLAVTVWERAVAFTAGWPETPEAPAASEAPEGAEATGGVEGAEGGEGGDAQAGAAGGAHAGLWAAFLELAAQQLRDPALALNVVRPHHAGSLTRSHDSAILRSHAHIFGPVVL